jgi:hypothetical protein
MDRGTKEDRKRRNTVVIAPLVQRHHPSTIFYPNTVATYGNDDDDDYDDYDSMSDHHEMNENGSSHSNIACATVLCKVLTRNEVENGYCSNGREGDAQDEEGPTFFISKNNDDNNEDHETNIISSSSQSLKSVMEHQMDNQELLRVPRSEMNCDYKTSDYNGGDNGYCVLHDNDQERKRKFEEIHAEVQHSFEIDEKNGPSNGHACTPIISQGKY